MPTIPSKLDIFVICAPGLEIVLRAEMLRLGVRPGAAGSGGISCRGGLDDVMRLNLELRSASRVVVRVASFHASTFHELERRTRTIRWNEFLENGRSAFFRVTCRKSKLYHSDAVAQRFGDAVTAKLPGVKVESNAGNDEGEAASVIGQQFLVRLFRDEVTVSVDSSGELLHRRGYRLATAKAPIRETLAAGMLLASEWSGDQTLLDPLCGSGTIPIEAALIARRIAPGRSRNFAFMNWPAFNSGSWDRMLRAADNGVLPVAAARIFASDRDEGAIEATKANAERAGVGGDIEIRAASMTEAIDRAATLNTRGLLVANPPYGKRVAGASDPRDLYASLGRSVREKLSGWTLLVISNESRLLSQLKVPSELLFSASNGGIPVQLVRGIVPGKSE